MQDPGHERERPVDEPVDPTREQVAKRLAVVGLLAVAVAVLALALGVPWWIVAVGIGAVVLVVVLEG